MSMTQFAMVEELAFLVKDNLQCKHLILSVEETLINFLQDDTRFAHESVGEGDDRHLILERCLETSIPSILVSDILWQYDGSQSSTSHQILRKKDASSELKTKLQSFQNSFEEREAAYAAARERIFSMDEGESKEPVKQKPRNIPVVARRMIAHALGKRISSYSEEHNPGDGHECGGKTKESSIREEDKFDPSSSLESLHREQVYQKPADRKSYDVAMPPYGKSGADVNRGNLKAEHLGAAKRIFAQALGRHSAKDGVSSKSSETKQSDAITKQINRVKVE